MKDNVYQCRDLDVKIALEKLRNIMDNIYRCGYCGTPTDKEGTPLSLGECNDLDSPQLDNAELVNGYCCYEEQTREKYQITRDMALDA